MTETRWPTKPKCLLFLGNYGKQCVDLGVYWVDYKPTEGKNSGEAASSKNPYSSIIVKDERIDSKMKATSHLATATWVSRALEPGDQGCDLHSLGCWLTYPQLHLSGKLVCIWTLLNLAPPGSEPYPYCSRLLPYIPKKTVLGVSPLSIHPCSGNKCSDFPPFPCYSPGVSPKLTNPGQG